ncbi:phage holin family protein [Alkaliphilus peptidifermentans]|uniref:Toxin secretion/phage lysis holin n=1 Tax=Alkaliphilus peptidifermentans DSM 18978 TaxID=1120976 RepID=A0A1G5EDV2_9FIRM|nr:toxin secretion/phage lysis holin [Alkaliphilus peptidifermentans DSM 18978]
MKDFINSIQFIFTAVGAFLGWFLGGFDGFLYALLAFVTIDYVTGIMLAVLQKKLSSEIGFHGIFKKVLIFTMVAVGHTVDTYIIQNGSAIRTAVIFFYLSNEGISILENASKIGLPIPDKLKGVLSQLSREDE